MKTIAKGLLDSIKKNGASLNNFTATLGFDGFIDYINRVVKSETENMPEYYSTMKEFGTHLVDRSGKSCALEIIEQTIKAGGNMPIMSIALGMLGLKVNCIGALGYPTLHPEFKKNMKDIKGDIYSIGDPGITNAMEFNDGKVMLVKMQPLNNIDWEYILGIISKEEIIKLFSKSDLISFVNWSEMKNSNDIWKGMLKDIFPNYETENKQRMFFDLADCSRKKPSELKTGLTLMNQFSNTNKVILGLNENECYQVLRALEQSSEGLDIEEVGALIFEQLKLDVLVIHTVEAAYAWNCDGYFKVGSYFCESPKISTGGGDNFNAGICASLLMNLEIKEALLFANAVTRLYISNGVSPSLEDIIEFVKTQGAL